MPQAIDSSLQSLAAYLTQNQGAILEDWEKSLDDDNGKISKLISLSREKFYDHIPDFLDRVCMNLGYAEKPTEDAAQEHGALRWQYGFDLREVTKEWSELHRVLMNHTRTTSDKLSLSSFAVEEAQAIIARLIHEGILHSINEYYRLQNLETQAKIRDLNQTLEKKEQERMDHSQHLQQTTHDLKGILFSLQTGLSLLEKKDLDEDAAKIVKETSLAADSFSQLMSNLLDLFRLEAGQKEVELTSVDVGELLTDLANSLEPMAQASNLDLICRGQDSFIVEGDRTKIKRIAQNLLVNSLKYTDEGSVEICWKQNSTDDWMLIIRDTGPGFELTDLNDGKNIQGEGIGLLIVRQLCKLLDGVIDVESKPDVGTVFKIIIPISYS